MSIAPTKKNPESHTQTVRQRIHIIAVPLDWSHSTCRLNSQSHTVALSGKGSRHSSPWPKLLQIFHLDTLEQDIEHEWHRQRNLSEIRLKFQSRVRWNYSSVTEVQCPLQITVSMWELASRVVGISVNTHYISTVCAHHWMPIHNQYASYRLWKRSWLHENVHCGAGAMTIMSWRFWIQNPCSCAAADKSTRPDIKRVDTWCGKQSSRCLTSCRVYYSHIHIRPPSWSTDFTHHALQKWSQRSCFKNFPL